MKIITPELIALSPDKPTPDFIRVSCSNDVLEELATNPELQIVCWAPDLTEQDKAYTRAIQRAHKKWRHPLHRLKYRALQSAYASHLVRASSDFGCTVLAKHIEISCRSETPPSTTPDWKKTFLLPPGKGRDAWVKIATTLTNAFDKAANRTDSLTPSLSWLLNISNPRVVALHDGNKKYTFPPMSALIFKKNIEDRLFADLDRHDGQILIRRSGQGIATKKSF